MKVCDICKGELPASWAPAIARVTFEVIPEGLAEGIDHKVLGIQSKYVSKDVCFVCLTNGEVIKCFVKEEEPYPEPEREEDI